MARQWPSLQSQSVRVVRFYGVRCSRQVCAFSDWRWQEAIREWAKDCSFVETTISDYLHLLIFLGRTQALERCYWELVECVPGHLDVEAREAV